MGYSQGWMGQKIQMEECYKDYEFLSFASLKDLASSRFSLNVCCMEPYLKALEFGLCLVVEPVE